MGTATVVWPRSEKPAALPAERRAIFSQVSHRVFRFPASPISLNEGILLYDPSYIPYLTGSGLLGFSYSWQDYLLSLSAADCLCQIHGEQMLKLSQWLCALISGMSTMFYECSWKLCKQEGANTHRRQPLHKVQCGAAWRFQKQPRIACQIENFSSEPAVCKRDRCTIRCGLAQSEDCCIGIWLRMLQRTRVSSRHVSAVFQRRNMLRPGWCLPRSGLAGNEIALDVSCQVPLDHEPLEPNSLTASMRLMLFRCTATCPSEWSPMP